QLESLGSSRQTIPTHYLPPTSEPLPPHDLGARRPAGSRHGVGGDLDRPLPLIPFGEDRSGPVPPPRAGPDRFLARRPVSARVAIISNPRSEGNRSNGGGALRAALGWPGLCAHAELDDFRMLPEIIERFRQAEIDLVILDGGDGTVQ